MQPGGSYSYLVSAGQLWAVKQQEGKVQSIEGLLPASATDSELPSALQNHLAHNSSEGEVELYLLLPRSMLQPKGYFTAEEAHKAIKYVHALTDEDDVLHHSWGEYTVSYPLSKLLRHDLKQVDERIRLLPYIKPWLAYTQHQNTQGEHLQVVVTPNRLYLIAFERKLPLLSNSFAIKNEQDVLYYILFVMERLGINSQQAIVRGSGSLDAQSWHTIRRYLPHFRLCEEVGGTTALQAPLQLIEGIALCV